MLVLYVPDDECRRLESAELAEKADVGRTGSAHRQRGRGRDGTAAGRYHIHAGGPSVLS